MAEQNGNGYGSRISHLKEALAEHKADNEKDHSDLWKAMQRMEDKMNAKWMVLHEKLDRLPVWASLLYMALSGLLGFALAWAIK